jgi:hypothetical protein
MLNEMPDLKPAVTMKEAALVYGEHFDSFCRRSDETKIDLSPVAFANTLRIVRHAVELERQGHDYREALRDAH